MTAPSRESVGDVLRNWRERRGRSVEDVAQTLRIRLVYLHAIEDGRPDDLPGKIYAIGFVRSYAEYLGLDVAKVVERFKREVADLEDRQKLVFPEPRPDRGVPGGAIVAVSVCLAIMVYGTWYYQTAQTHAAREATSPMAAHLAETPDVPPRDAARIVGDPTQLTTGELLPTLALTETADFSRQLNVPVAAADEDTARENSATALDDAEQTVNAGAAPPPNRSQPGEDASRGAEAASPLEPARARTAPPPPPPLPATAVATRSADERLQNRPAQAGMLMRGAAPAQAAEVPRDGYIDGPNELVLRAIQDTWIEIRSETTGEVVIGRLMREGDSYTVPPRPDLKLTTGNAGGLQILVDGEAIPRLGPTRAVIRNIALNGDRLLAGTAMPN